MTTFDPTPTISPQAMVIALDLGGTKLASCLFSAAGQPLMRHVVPLEQRHGRAVGALISGEIKHLKDAAGENGGPIEAVGVSVPGIVGGETGRVWAPNIAGWDAYPLQAEIGAALGDSSVRVVIDSDRAAYILGEAWQGAVQGCRDAIFLAVGTGIGAGILTSGQVLRGAHGIAGAIGWLALDRPYRSEYKSCGCFEAHASGVGLAKQFAAALSLAPDSRGELRGGESADDGPVTAQDVFAAYERGDEVAQRVLAEAVEFWGMACANLVSLFDPEVIVFGGGVFGPATRFLDDIAQQARCWAQPISMSRVRLAASRLGSDAGLYGAGYLALFGAQQDTSFRRT